MKRSKVSRIMEVKVTLINAFISIVVAAVTGWFAAKQSYSREIKKTVYAERQNLYIDLFSLLEELLHTPLILFNNAKFIQPFREMKIKANLYASDAVLALLLPFNDEVIEKWEKYAGLYDSEPAENEIQNRLIRAKENAESSRDQIEYEFQQEEELYMEQNAISDDEVRELLNKLSFQIRSELGTEK